MWSAWQQRVRVHLPSQSSLDFNLQPLASPRLAPSSPVSAEVEVHGRHVPGMLLFLTQVLDVYEEDLVGWLIDHVVDISDLHVDARSYQIHYWITERREVELDVLFVLYPHSAPTTPDETVTVPLPLAALLAVRRVHCTGTIRLALPDMGWLQATAQQGRVDRLEIVSMEDGATGPWIEGLSLVELAAGIAGFLHATPFDSLLSKEEVVRLRGAREVWQRRASLSFTRTSLVVSLFCALLAIGFSKSSQNLHNQSLSLHQLRDSLQMLLNVQAAYSNQIIGLIGTARRRTNWSERLSELSACSSDSVLWTDVLATSDQGYCVLHGLALSPDAVLRMSDCVTRGNVLVDAVLSPVRLAKKSELPPTIEPSSTLLFFELSGAVHE